MSAGKLKKDEIESLKKHPEYKEVLRLLMRADPKLDLVIVVFPEQNMDVLRSWEAINAPNFNGRYLFYSQSLPGNARLLGRIGCKRHLWVKRIIEWKQSNLAAESRGEIKIETSYLNLD